MDNFDLKKFLVENKLTSNSRLQESLLFEEVSDDAIEKAAAALLGIKPDQVADQEPTDQEKKQVDEELVSMVLLGVTIAGLIPPALQLVGNLTNKTKQLVGLTPEQKKELARLDELIAGKKKYIQDLDKKNNPKQWQEVEELEKLEKEKDEKFGTIVGNWAKHAGHTLHHWYTVPIVKFLKMVAWTQAKFGKKGGKLQDEGYRQRLANVIYAVIMLGVASYGIISHIRHLAGVGPIITTLADGVKAGKSVAEIVQGVASLI
jgi:hypothetical protein